VKRAEKKCEFFFKRGEQGKKNDGALRKLNFSFYFLILNMSFRVDRQTDRETDDKARHIAAFSGENALKSKKKRCLTKKDDNVPFGLTVRYLEWSCLGFL
jgi:hypothetical protein